MTTPPLEPPPAPAKPAGAGPWLKVLLGCAIGCGVVAVLGFLAIGGGFWWLVSPGEQVETGRVVGGESVGVIHVTGLDDDPGTRALLTRAVVEMQRASDRQRATEMPEQLRWIQEMGRAQSGGASGLEMWIPREVTVAIEPGEDGEPAFVVALNLSMFPRLIRTMVRQIARTADAGGPLRESHRGYEMEVFPEGGALAFADSTLLFASRAEALRRALDRLEDGAEPGPMAALLEAAGSDRWDVHGALLDHDGSLGDSLAEMLPRPARPATAAEPAPGALEAPERAAGATVGVVESPPAAGDDPPAPAVERATFGLDVVTADRIEAEIRLDCASEAGARAWLARLEEALRHLEAAHGRGALAAGIAGTVEGARLRAEVELTGIDAWLERAIAESMAEPPEDGETE